MCIEWIIKAASRSQNKPKAERNDNDKESRNWQRRSNVSMARQMGSSFTQASLEDLNQNSISQHAVLCCGKRTSLRMTSCRSDMQRTNGWEADYFMSDVYACLGYSVNGIAQMFFLATPTSTHALGHCCMCFCFSSSCYDDNDSLDGKQTIVSLSFDVKTDLTRQMKEIMTRDDEKTSRLEFVTKMIRALMFVMVRRELMVLFALDSFWKVWKELGKIRIINDGESRDNSHKNRWHAIAWVGQDFGEVNK